MLTIDLDSPEPLYEQIVHGLRRAIAGRTVRVGDRLPSVRQLADDLAVNLNTVARAYRRLEDDGLVRVRHGQGAVVVSDRVPEADRGGAAERLSTALGHAFAEARLAGMSSAAVRRTADRVIAASLGAPSASPSASLSASLSASSALSPSKEKS